MTTEEIEAAAAATDDAATTEAEATVELTEEEAFDAAFDEATLVLDTDETTGDPADDNAGATDAEGSGTDDTGDSDPGTGGGDTGADGDGTDDAAGTTGAADPATTGDESGSTEQEAIADAPTAKELALQAQIDAMTAAAAVAPVAAPVVDEPAAAPEVAPTLTTDEAAIVAAYREEWGDVATAEALIRKEENQVIVGYVFKQVQDVIAPLLKAHENRNGRDQYDDLVTLVPDYDTVRDKAVDWVDKLPEGVNKKIYTEVTQTGTPDEVAEMINAFKKATGYESSKTGTAAASATPAAAAAPVPKPAAAGATKKPSGKAAAALRVVNTVRSKTNTGGPDVNDYDGAFDEFAEKK